jgi:hypothetical protein
MIKKMKQCRFCNNEIPFYGRDTCDFCLELLFKDESKKIVIEESEKGDPEECPF